MNGVLNPSKEFFTYIEVCSENGGANLSAQKSGNFLINLTPKLQVKPFGFLGEKHQIV